MCQLLSMRASRINEQLLVNTIMDAGPEEVVHACFFIGYPLNVISDLCFVIQLSYHI